MGTDTIETTETETDDEPAIDMAAAVSELGSQLFPESHKETPETEPAPDPVATVTEAIAPAPPTVHEVPKSWAKEVHDYWGKIDPKAQEYIKKREKDFLDGLDQYKGAAQYGQTLQKAIAPYEGYIKQQGVEIPYAIQTLLAAHQQLTSGPVEQRVAAIKELARNMGLDKAFAAQYAPTDPTQPQPPQPQSDPRVQQLEQQFQQIRETLTAREKADFEAARSKASQEVSTFASDPKNAYFDEVSADTAAFITQGLPLQEAYERAVWANPVTRAKEIARVQTERDAQLKENARLAALPKNKAKGVNVNGKESMRAPTEPLGTIEESLKKNYRAITEKIT